MKFRFKENSSFYIGPIENRRSENENSLALSHGDYEKYQWGSAFLVFFLVFMVVEKVCKILIDKYEKPKRMKGRRGEMGQCPSRDNRRHSMGLCYSLCPVKR